MRFEGLSIAEEEVLTMVLYSRADSWLGWGESRESDNVLNSLGRIFLISMHGLAATFKSVFTDKDKRSRKSTSLSIAGTSMIVMLAAMLATGGSFLQGQTTVGAAQNAASSKTLTSNEGPTTSNSINTKVVETEITAGHYQDTFTLQDAGSPQIELHGIDSLHHIYFTLPETHVARSAKIHIFYAFSPKLLPQLSHIKLLLNGTLFATLQPRPEQAGGPNGQDAEADFPIPPDLIVHNNRLTFEFIGHYAMSCEDPANTTLWARVHRTTFLEIRGDLLPVAEDLKHLPMPFLDPAVIQPSSIPVVFATPPSLKAIQAAGVVTSYFGMVSEGRAVRFPVQFGSIPHGNVIVIAENPANLPAGVAMPIATAPTLAIRTNPNDPFGKILIVAGANADQTLVAAQAVAMHSEMLAGGQTTIGSFRLPDRRLPDDAPRWARTDQTIALWDYAKAEQLQGDGTAPLNVDFRIPPDIFYADDRPNSLLRLAYRYNSIPIGPISSMQVRINNTFLDSVPLIPGAGGLAQDRSGMLPCRWRICGRFRIRFHSTSRSNC